MIPKAFVASVVAVAGILATGPGSAQAADERVPFTPPLAGSAAATFGNPAAPLRDRVIEGEVPATGQLEKTAAVDIVPDGDGHFIKLSVSSGYLPSPEANQDLGLFFGSLLHGNEMGKLSVYVATPSEMAGLCGSGAAACYYSDKDKMMIVGESMFGGFPTTFVAAHEYGHHVANHRRNDPWRGIETGPKRWATFEGVCPNTRNGLYFPGDEGAHYFDNPGEAFAEAYAKYDSRFRAFDWDWNVKLRPGAAAYASIQDDVLDPWDGNNTSEFTGSVRRGKSFTRSFATPLDGGLSIKLSGPRNTDFDLYVRNRRGQVLRRAETKGSRERIRMAVCGQSRLKFTVASFAGSGPAQVTLSKP